MGEFIEAFKAIKGALGGSKQQMPDESHSQAPQLMQMPMDDSPMMQPQPEGAPNAMAAPSTNFLDTLSSIRHAPRDWAQDMKHDAMNSLGNLFR